MENKKMFVIVRNGCPKGMAFVRDNTGNKLYYGKLPECKDFIFTVEKEVHAFCKTHLSTVYGRSVTNG